MTAPCRASFWVLALALALPASAAAAGVPAVVELRNGAKWEVEFLRRDERRWVFLQQKGQAVEIGFPAAEFVKVEFPLRADGETGNIQEQYRLGQFGRAAAELELMLGPILPFLDLPGNAAPYARLLLRCYYFDDRFQDAFNLSHIIERVPDETVAREAQLFRALARLGLGFRDDAEAQFQKVPPVAATNELGAVAWYSQTRLHLAARRWAAASETAAQAIVFQSKNFEWLPPLLLASAEAQANLDNKPVASQIAAEIQMMVPGTRWAERAAAAQQQYGPVEPSAAEPAAATNAPPAAADAPASPTPQSEESSK